jgi:hypothetical protein
MPEPSQFNTDRTHPGRWTITFSNPPINMFVPTTIVELGALMTELQADPSVKLVVFQSANPDSRRIAKPALAKPAVVQRYPAPEFSVSLRTNRSSGAPSMLVPSSRSVYAVKLAVLTASTLRF